MVKAALNSLSYLNYEHFEVLVIDNNTKDPAIWRPIEAHCKKLGPRFKFFHVDPLPGFKAGALNYLISKTAVDAEVVAVIDADYCVDRNWLKHTVPHFQSPNIAVVQAPQNYRDHKDNLFKRCCFSEYWGFFNIGMVIRNNHNAIIQHGTMTLIRKSVMSTLQWAPWCICEDAELGLRALQHGYTLAYVRNSYGRGLIPDTFTDFKKQRFRWAYGAIQIIKQHRTSLITGREGKLSLAQRYYFLAGWLPWAAQAVNSLLTFATLVWSACMIMPALKLAPLPWIYSAAPVLIMALTTIKTLCLYDRLVTRDIAEASAAILAGIALYHTIAKAVLYGFFTSSMPFFRTPKNADSHGLPLAISEAREELFIMLLLWGAALGIYRVQGLPSYDVCFWVMMLLVQSLPYLAALIMAFLSSLPKPKVQTEPAMASNN
jgi:cellulose synthase/poly-beta-1,6-N-acetylglucosamine synthase-like glycosyltransferase